MNPEETKKLRKRILKQKGVIVWLTGLPGSGKSTLAQALEERLLVSGRLPCVLDGDIVRRGLNSDLGFSDSDRNENIRRVAEVAAILKETSVIAIVAFISPFIKMREFAREKAGSGSFIEVHVKASLETCIKRDPKGMYRKAVERQLKEFTGITSAYEEPPRPEVVIDTEKLSVDEAADILFKEVLKYTDTTE